MKFINYINNKPNNKSKYNIILIFLTVFFNNLCINNNLSDNNCNINIIIVEVTIKGEDKS